MAHVSADLEARAQGPSCCRFIAALTAVYLDVLMNCQQFRVTKSQSLSNVVIAVGPREKPLKDSR